jgi:hypothetical protein
MFANTKNIVAMHPRMHAAAGLIRAALLTVLVCVAACSSAQAQSAPLTEAGLVAKGAKKLGAADFDTLYVGNTLTGKTTEGDDFHVFVEGKSTYRMAFQGKQTSDKWSAGQDGTFCTVADTETTCTREVLDDKTIYSFNADGSLAGTAQIRPGNPEKL